MFNRYEEKVSEIINLSVVVPVFNECDSLKELHCRLEKILLQMGNSYEIIYVDDGSQDGSKQLLEKIINETNHTSLISLIKNRGKASTLALGFEEARGKYIVTIDSDLQDCPEEIPKLLEKLEEGFDIVSGWKVNRKDGFVKRISSTFFNRVVSLYSGIHLKDYNCGLKAYRKEALERIKIYGQHHRYIMLYLGFSGYRLTEIPVKHSERKHGKSKYGMSRFFWAYFDFITGILLTRFISTPMYLFGIFFLGFEFIALIFSVLLISFHSGFGETQTLYIILWLTNLLFIFTGILLLGMGLIAELMIFIYHNPDVKKLLYFHSKHTSKK